MTAPGVKRAVILTDARPDRAHAQAEDTVREKAPVPDTRRFGEERLAGFVAGIDAGHYVVAMLPPSLEDGHDPRQALGSGAARRHPDLAQPDAPPAPGLRKQPLAP